MGDYRTTQQAGWVTRAFGPVKAVVLPEPTGAEQRVMEVSYPNRGGKEGDLFLTSLLSLTGCEWVNIATVGAAGDEMTEGGVYRLLVGKAAISAWVDLPLWVMAGRIAYWPSISRIVGVIEHPDSILAAGAGKKRKIEAVSNFMRVWGDVVRGDQPVMDLLARDCVKCAEADVAQCYVTEIDANGLGLCKRHGGWDVRPEGQRWQQERMF